MSTAQEIIQKLANKNPKSAWKESVASESIEKDQLEASVEIAMRILDVLDQKGWKQADLAAKLGVSPQQVSKIVKGRENLTLETIVKIEKVMGIKLITILQEDEIVVSKEHYQYVASNYATNIDLGNTFSYNNILEYEKAA